MHLLGKKGVLFEKILQKIVLFNLNEICRFKNKVEVYGWSCLVYAVRLTVNNYEI